MGIVGSILAGMFLWLEGHTCNNSATQSRRTARFREALTRRVHRRKIQLATLDEKQQHGCHHRPRFMPPLGGKQNSGRYPPN